MDTHVPLGISLADRATLAAGEPLRFDTATGRVAGHTDPPIVAGSRASGAALANLLTALDAAGLVVDATEA